MVLQLHLTDGTDIPQDPGATADDPKVCTGKFAPINNIGHSAFESVVIIINGFEFTLESGHYGYRCDLLDQLSHAPGVKNTRLVMQGYYDDTDGVLANKESPGHKERAEAFDGSKSVEILTKVSWDLKGQPGLLPSHLPILFRFKRAPPQFCCMSFPVAADIGQKRTCRIDIKQASLKVRRVRLTHDAEVRKIRQMEKSPLYFPLSRLITRTLNIPANVHMYYFDNPFSGKKLTQTCACFILYLLIP